MEAANGKGPDSGELPTDMRPNASSSNAFNIAPFASNREICQAEARDRVDSLPNMEKREKGGGRELYSIHGEQVRWPAW